MFGGLHDSPFVVADVLVVVAVADAAQPWLDQHPAATVLPVGAAFALGGPLTQTLLTADGESGCC